MNRRTLLTTALAGAAISRLPRAYALQPPQPDIGLDIVKRTLDVNGRAASVFGLIGPGGVHGLRFKADEQFRIAVINNLDAPTLLHWHGLTPPFEYDGVPDLTAPMMQPGTARIYNFPVGKGGTHWMHAHTLQEQNLLAAPLIVRTTADLAADEQEVVILLHDFSFTPAEELLAKLQGPGGHGTMDHGSMNHGTAGHGAAHGAAPMDLNDINFDAYLANDRTLNDPQIVRVERNARVRLRIINGATATAFTIDTGALDAQVIAVDGQDISPFTTRRVPLSMGQRVDLRIDVRTAGAFPILALREGARERTGLILATPDAAIARIAPQAEHNGPVLDLAFEQQCVQIVLPGTRRRERLANKKFNVALTGSMAGYDWGMESDAPLRIAKDDRVEIIMRNTSMMAHPMHLHGHHFEVVAINGQRKPGAIRDTVLVPPDSSMTIAFDADNVGKWAFHCHHLYHMAAGMMQTIDYVS